MTAAKRILPSRTLDELPGAALDLVGQLEVADEPGNVTLRIRRRDLEV
jgi:hypothetical protein